MKNYDWQTVVGVGLCVLLLLIWMPLMRIMGWLPPPRSARDAEQPTAPPAAVAETDAGAADVETEAATPAVPAPAAAAAGWPRPDQSGAGALISSASWLTARIDAERGGVTAVTLQQYRKESDGQDLVVLGAVPLPFATVVPMAPGTDFGPGRVVAQSDHRLELEHGQAVGGLLLTESWELIPGRPYEMTYTMTLRNQGAEAATAEQLGVACGGMPAAGSGGRFASRAAMGTGGIDIRLAGSDRPKNFTFKKLAKLDAAGRRAFASTPVHWVALHSKYFMFYLNTGPEAVPGVLLETAEMPAAAAGTEAEKWTTARLLLPTLRVPAGEARSLTFSCYMGPKEYGRLRPLGAGLEAIMGMDRFLFWHPAWMGWISRQVLTALIALNDRFNQRWGYGLAIVVVTLVVKILFWPLTHRSTVSMRKMQRIQPHMKELREKYKGQAEKLNRKMMELYREHKVNPLGGCLPILCQIPVFFALFNTFRSAIELRHASFLWVADLSVPDTVAAPFGIPIRPLAILMAGSMFGQQKLMPTHSDPSQARMMNFMTLFFMFIFYNMPAGLTLYWTVNQLLTILQNVVTRKLEKKSESAPA